MLAPPPKIHLLRPFCWSFLCRISWRNTNNPNKELLPSSLGCAEQALSTPVFQHTFYFGVWSSLNKTLQSNEQWHAIHSPPVGKVEITEKLAAWRPETYDTGKTCKSMRGVRQACHQSSSKDLGYDANTTTAHCELLPQFSRKIITAKPKTQYFLMKINTLTPKLNMSFGKPMVWSPKLNYS